MRLPKPQESGFILLLKALDSGLLKKIDPKFFKTLTADEIYSLIVSNL